MKYIAFDVHPRDMLVVVIDEDGDCIHSKKLPTSAELAIKTVEMFAGDRLVIFEDSDVTGWLVWELRRRDHEVLVADPVENAWTARDENIDDEQAAMKLAKLARAGLINSVHHPESKRKG